MGPSHGQSADRPVTVIGGSSPPLMALLPTPVAQLLAETDRIAPGVAWDRAGDFCGQHMAHAGRVVAKNSSGMAYCIGDVLWVSTQMSFKDGDHTTVLHHLSGRAASCDRLSCPLGDAQPQGRSPVWRCLGCRLGRRLGDRRLL